MEALLERLVYNLVNGWPISSLIRDASRQSLSITIVPLHPNSSTVQVRVSEVVPRNSDVKGKYVCKLVDVFTLDPTF